MHRASRRPRVRPARHLGATGAAARGTSSWRPTPTRGVGSSVIILSEWSRQTTTSPLVCHWCLHREQGGQGAVKNCYSGRLLFPLVRRFMCDFSHKTTYHRITTAFFFRRGAPTGHGRRGGKWEDEEVRMSRMRGRRIGMPWKGGWGRGRQGALPGVRLAEPVHRATRSQRGVEALGAFRPALSPSVSFCTCSEYC